jgi:hypothetical protein
MCNPKIFQPPELPPNLWNGSTNIKSLQWTRIFGRKSGRYIPQPKDRPPPSRSPLNKCYHLRQSINEKKLDPDMAISMSKSLDLKLDRGFGRKSTEFDDGKSHTTKRRSRPNSSYMEHLQRRLSTNQQRYQSSVISEQKNFTIENPVHLKILFNKTPWVPNITVQSNIGRGQPRSRVLSAQQVFQRKSENLDKSKFFKNPYSTGAFKRMVLRKKDS